MSSLGLVSLTYGMIESSTYGWFGAKKAWEFAGQNFNLLGGLSISFYSVLIGVVVLIGFGFY